MSTLVKNVREYTGYGGFPAPTSQFSTDSAENRSKPIDNSFSDSKLFKAASEAGDYLKSSKLKYAAKIYIFKDLSMAKIEFNINCIEMTPVAVDNMGLTYDSTLSINFRYNPDVLPSSLNHNLAASDHEQPELNSAGLLCAQLHKAGDEPGRDQGELCEQLCARPGQPVPRHPQAQQEDNRGAGITS